MEKRRVLETIDLQKHFGDIKAVDGVFLSVAEGQRHAIIGPNGAGKTTFFHLISGRYKPTRGKIKFKGRDITGMSPHCISRRGLARSFQIINVFPGLSVFENVRSVLMSKRGIHYNFVKDLDGWQEIIEEALSILERIRLADKRDERAGYLSYGDQRALEVGLTIASDPDLVLLDEPTAGMSMEETRQAIRLIEKVTQGKTLVIIEHDMEVVFSLADVVTVMNYGRIVTSGPPEQIRKDPKVKEAYLGDQ